MRTRGRVQTCYKSGMRFVHFPIEEFITIMQRLSHLAHWVCREHVACLFSS